MSSRNRLAWERPPRLPPTHYVDAAAYSDPGVFADEMDRIMARCWRFACHESELPDPFDFRTVDHAEVPLVLVRGGDRRIRTFYNVCPHRGAKLFNDLSGNAERKTCFFHHWTFDWEGNCVGRPRTERSRSRGPGTLSARAITGCSVIGPWKWESTS